MIFIVVAASIILFFIIRKILQLKRKPDSFESLVLYAFREIGIGAAIFAAGALMVHFMQNLNASYYINIGVYILMLSFMAESAYVLHSYYKELPRILHGRSTLPELRSIPTPLVTEKQVVEALMKHSEINKFRESMEIAQQKFGLMIDEEDDYWIVRVYEDHPTHIATYGFYKVDKHTGKVKRT